MTRKSLADHSCSVARVVDIIGDQWSLLILRESFLGVSTFSGYMNELGISRNILSTRLNTLIKHNILDKETVGNKRYRYRLTDSGTELLPVLITILQWGDKWIFGTKGEPVIVLDKDTRSPIQRVGIISRDGRFLNINDLLFEVGPGGKNSPEIIDRLSKIAYPINDTN
jgi:DNA-binding HxlR family transcriptional regulator